MIHANKEIFLQRSVHLIMVALAKKGILILNSKDLEESVLQVGQLYYEMERLEEL